MFGVGLNVALWRKKSEVPEILIGTPAGVFLGAGPVATMPAGEVLEVSCKVVGGGYVFGGGFGDVSVVHGPSSVAGPWERLSEINSIVGACRRGIESGANRIFVNPGKVGKGNSRERQIAGRRDVEWISGDSGIEFHCEETGASLLMFAHTPGAGDVVGLGPVCPGCFLWGGEVPEVGIGFFQEFADLHPKVCLVVNGAGAALGDRSGLADVKGYSASAAGDRVDAV